MGLTAAKKKAARNMPKSLSSFRVGPWLFVYEHKPSSVLKSAFNVFKFDYASWFKNVREAPVRRYVMETYQLSPVLFFVYVTAYLFMGLRSALTLYHSNQLFTVVEASLAEGTPNVRQVLGATAVRVLGIALVASCQWFISTIKPMYNERITAHFQRRFMEAHLRQDLLSLQSKHNLLKSDSHDTAIDTLDALLQICTTLSSVISQVAVVAQILRKREGGTTLLLLGIAQPLFRYLTQADLWQYVAIFWVDDEWCLRARALFKSATEGKYQQEILSGGLAKYITREYEKAEKNNRAGSGDDLYGSFHRSSTPFFYIAMMVLDDLSLIYLALLSVWDPRKFSIASLAIITQTNMTLRNVWSSIIGYNDNVTAQLNQLKRLYAALEQKSGHDTGTLPYPPEESSGTGGVAITLRDVTFRYPGGEEDEKPRAAVSNVTFTIPSSSMVVIVGENGSGKSSLVKILANLYRPTSGTVLVDGTDAKEYKVEDLANVTALLTQDHLTFPLDIAENIGIGDPDCAGDMARIKEAAELGGAAGFIEKLDFGYEDVLEHINTIGSSLFTEELGKDLQKLYDEVERPKDISGGEKQRLAAARTFMRLTSGRVKLLIADEPTSAMDPAAEFQLFERLRAMRKGKTMVFVTHRFGHLTKHADLILCMKDGELVESGTHRELVEKNGEYQRLYHIQAQAFVDV